jgi:hypothetical protein
MTDGWEEGSCTTLGKRPEEIQIRTYGNRKLKWTSPSEHYTSKYRSEEKRPEKNGLRK